MSTSQKGLGDIATFGEELLDLSLKSLDAAKAANGTNINNKSSQRSSGCPFYITSVNDPLRTKFDFHYEITIFNHPYDFFFDSLNYSKENLNRSKKILSMPHHLRNTLFIRHEKVKQIRQMDFSRIYIIAEEVKEKTNDLYNNEEYSKALDQYNLVYSLYKWIEITDKNKEERLLNNSHEISLNPIIDSDIILKKCRLDHNTQYEDETFRSSMTFLLKAMGYCYIHMQMYSEAIKCLNEALEYNDDSKPDVYFRRGQARLFNKYSTRESLIIAMDDFKKAIKRKQGEKVIDDHYKLLKELIKTKEEMEIEAIKKLLHNFNYAYAMIRKKQIDIKQHFSKNYEMNHFNYKILKEMVEMYYYTLKYLKKTHDSKKYEKGIKEFEAFQDSHIQYNYFYELDIGKLPKWIIDSLNDNEKEDIAMIIHSDSLSSIFNDFKYKRCDDIFMDIKLNQKIWEKCFEIVTEKEKLNCDTNITKPHDYVVTFQKYLKSIGTILHINQTQFYSLSALFLIFSIMIILSQLYT